MNILGVQIISILFAVFMIYVTFLHRKRKELGASENAFWMILWLGFIGVVLFPQLLQGVTQVFLFARVLDLLMVIAFMILTFIGFQNYISNKRMEQKIEKLVRKKAIEKINKNK